jgi:lysozyme
LDIITPSEAEALLREDAEVAADSVRRIVKVPLAQGEFDCLVSFFFNIGEGKLVGSNTIRLLNEGDRNGFLRMHSRWTRSNGKVLPGLVKRRQDEAKLFRGEQ